MPTFRSLISGLSFAECPRWRDGRLYVSDYFNHRVLAISMDGETETIAQLHGRPAGLGFLPDGRLLMTSMCERCVMRREADGTLVLHADLSHLAPWQVNDMLVDAEGRAYVGNFGFDLYGGATVCSTVLIAVEPDGTVPSSPMIWDFLMAWR